MALKDTEKTNVSKSSKSSYSISDVLKITDELFKLSKEKNYPPGAFIHALIFALEFAQQSYNIPPQQLAEIKRDCRRTVHEIVATRTKTPVPEPKK